MIAIVFVKFASSHELAGLIADTEPMRAEFFSAKHDNFTANYCKGSWVTQAQETNMPPFPKCRQLLEENQILFEKLQLARI